VQFIVKAAGVTHRVSVPVAPPQGGDGGLAVGAAGARTSRGGLEEEEEEESLEYRPTGHGYECNGFIFMFL